MSEHDEFLMWIQFLQRDDSTVSVGTATIAVGYPLKVIGFYRSRDGKAIKGADLPR